MREAKEIAADINAADTWEPELCAELCEAAGMTAEWEAAGPDDFERVLFDAAEKLARRNHLTSSTTKAR